ncbi:LysR family transcriptional regulator [Pseudemcibacter aquimaris]|uniref:LysR family transcriptional regulator n=1 Tax=Pseudemcibacter aquimaris TaxID=2857064 RepID=UPI0020133467|nr:LysR family transcriptional regulator [Pseudemcibacter aquimaris]MCC3861159.1 LysR family transcriptional regulator [Pseudemcibacter aquimaris]WDU57934.1 LysR family transcriptional regulator [Pseudemcibacter aquimaris]
MKAIDLNLLKVFEALYEEGNATRAAMQLGVSQAAVSASLARLRQTYNDVLFTRIPGGLEPTERANEIRPLIRNALNSVKQSLSYVDEGSQDRSINIGLSDDIEIAFGKDIIASIKELFPNARPVFKQAHNPVLADMLKNREIDIAIGSGGLSDRSIRAQSIGQTGYLTLSNFPPDNGRTFTLDEFLEHEHLLITFTEQGSSDAIGLIDEVLSQSNLRRKIAATTTHFSVAKYLLLGTKIITTIPSHAAVILSRTERLFMSRCPLDLKPYTIRIGMLSTNYKDQFLARIIENVEEAMRSQNNVLLAPYSQRLNRTQHSFDLE